MPLLGDFATKNTKRALTITAHDGKPTERALVAIAELQLYQAEGCRP